MNLANEGLEAKKKEEEVNSRKRKVEEDKNWEGASLGTSSFIQDRLIIISPHRKPGLTRG